MNVEAFKLPSRLIAKILIFRILYGGTEYSFARDPDFAEVSTSERFWKEKIEAFYDKYRGINKWHSSIISEATSTGRLKSPVGRYWYFQPDNKGNWPLTRIKNYPVQGLGADLMCLARVSFARRFKAAGIVGKLISTIHDSIVVDVADHEVDRVSEMFVKVFEDIPMNFERVFGEPFTLPTRCEISYGKNKYDLTEWKPSGTIVLSV
jgi:DNA polymerase I-like protein with 3'-5' exonuclease and polymerase domains